MGRARSAMDLGTDAQPVETDDPHAAEGRTRAPRYRAIAEELARRIRDGRQPLGSQLPVEHDLAVQFATSRQTIREALRLLAERGQIVRRAGSGTTVVDTEPRAQLHLSIGNLGQLLAYPEGVSRRHLSSGPWVADAAGAARLGCAEGTTWYRIRALRHEASTQRPISWVDIHIEPRFAAVAARRGVEHSPVVEQIEREYGERVDSAEVDIAVGRIDDEMAPQLQVEPGSPALVIVRRYAGSGDRAFEITVSVHPEQRYVYKMKLRKGRG